MGSALDRCDRLEDYNATALAVVAEHLIAEQNLPKTSAKAIRNAVKLGQPSKRRASSAGSIVASRGDALIKAAAEGKDGGSISFIKARLLMSHDS